MEEYVIMNSKGFGVITFKSTHHAMKADSVFKDQEVKFRTIPTPREITKSCGLSIRFNLEDIDQVEDIININQLENQGIFKITKNNKGSKAEKIS